MSQKAIKLVITGLVLAVAFGGLLYASLGENTAYYKHVDEVIGTPTQAEWYGKNLQLHGFVAPKTWVKKPGSLEYRFTVQQNGQSVPAYYTGILPDTFKEESEVVLNGTLRPDGFHVAPDGVIAKCPSKYEAKAVTSTSVVKGL